MQVPDIPHAAIVAEAIANDFYDDSLDLTARDVAPGSTWSRMPEVECVTRLRILGAKKSPSPLPILKTPQTITACSDLASCGMESTTTRCLRRVVGSDDQNVVG